MRLFNPPTTRSFLFLNENYQGVVEPPLILVTIYDSKCGGSLYSKIYDSYFYSQIYPISFNYYCKTLLSKVSCDGGKFRLQELPSRCYLQ
jgi:hypothetical protein